MLNRPLWFKIALTVVILVFADQIFRNAALAFLSAGPVGISDYFSFEIYKNYGIAFGVPISGGTLYFAVFIFLFLLFTGLLLDFNRPGKYQNPGLALLLAGAAGNMIDRIRWGYIIDFINVNDVFIFNLADVFIVVGGLMLLRSFMDSDKKAPNK